MYLKKKSSDSKCSHNDPIQRQEFDNSSLHVMLTDLCHSQPRSCANARVGSEALSQTSVFRGAMTKVFNEMLSVFCSLLSELVLLTAPPPPPQVKTTKETNRLVKPYKRFQSRGHVTKLKSIPLYCL